MIFATPPPIVAPDPAPESRAKKAHVIETTYSCWLISIPAWKMKYHLCQMERPALRSVLGRR